MSPKARKMNTPNNIQDELRDLNSELPASNGTPFSVPEGYFEGFAASVMNRIHNPALSAAAEIAELSPLLSAISRTMPYQLPEGYFQSNIETLPAFTAE